jgi:hypothetical protein
MTAHNVNSLALAAVILLVAVAGFAINWKLGCFATAFAIFKVVRLCVEARGR